MTPEADEEGLRKARPSVPDNTLETLARNFCREAEKYGFNQVDYLRYVNFLLDDAAQSPLEGEVGEGEEQGLDLSSPVSLPAEGEKVRLRAFDPESDAELLRRWLADDYGRYFLLSRISGRRSNVDALLANPTHMIGVIETKAGRPVGAVAYLNHDEKRCKAELRKVIGEPDCRGTGMAREATALWVRFGVTTLGLRKIYVNTLHTNFRNIRLNESLGFKVEGLLRNEALIDGVYHDVVRMGLWVEK